MTGLNENAKRFWAVDVWEVWATAVETQHTVLPPAASRKEGDSSFDGESTFEATARFKGTFTGWALTSGNASARESFTGVELYEDRGKLKEFPTSGKFEGEKTYREGDDKDEKTLDIDWQTGKFGLFLPSLTG